LISIDEVFQETVVAVGDIADLKGFQDEYLHERLMCLPDRSILDPVET
jgi:hypothetical protein